MSAPHPELEALARLADPELDAPDAEPPLADIADHVRSCDQCSADIAALRDVAARLAGLPIPPLPADVASQLDAALAAAARNPVSISPVTVVPSASGVGSRRWRPRFGAPTSIAAGVVLLVAIGVGAAIAIGSHGGGSATSSSSSPRSLAEAAAPSAAASGSVPLVISSNTDYTTAAFRQQIGAVLVSRVPTLAPYVSGAASAPAAGSSVAAAPASAAAPAASVPQPATPRFATPQLPNGPAAPQPNAPQPAGPLSSAAKLQACIDYLAGEPNATAVLVDHATFDGAPATIITLKDSQNAQQLVVYVIDDSLNCESGSVTFTAFLQASTPQG